MKVYTSLSSSSGSTPNKWLFELLIALVLYGAKNLKSITEECSVNMHMLVYSLSNVMGTKVDKPCKALLIWNTFV